MKAFKTIGLVILIIVIIFVLVSLFLPKKVHVERSVIIKSRQEVVFDLVNTIKNWETWSPWALVNSKAKIEYSGPASGKDAVLNWENGNREFPKGIIKISYSRQYDTLIAKIDLFNKGKFKGTFILLKSDSNVKLTWKITKNLGYNPVHKFRGLFMKKPLGNYLEKGLKALKELAEKTPASPSYKIEEVKVNKQTYISIKEAIKMADIKMTMGKDFGELMQFAGQNNLQCTGAPFCRYYGEPGSPKFEIEAGIPVNKIIPAKGRIKYGELTPGNALMVNYLGPYDKIGPVYMAIAYYAKQANKMIIGAPWEVYITDPSKEPDSNKWQTQVYFPVN